jgi:hypothetical protein
MFIRTVSTLHYSEKIYIHQKTSKTIQEW